MYTHTHTHNRKMHTDLFVKNENHSVKTQPFVCLVVDGLLVNNIPGQ